MATVGDQPVAVGGEAYLAGGGEVGALMRSFNWAASPLGAVEGWPRALKTCVRVLLTSRQPMWLGWGEQLTFIYNDACLSILGDKHPWALAQPTAQVWREIWADIAPRIHSTLQGDQGVCDEAMPLILERSGYPEESYYTFCYSPIPDDDNRIAGILCANSDHTRLVISDRQNILLRDLASRTADARSRDEVCSLSLQCLDTDPRDVQFGALYLIDQMRKCAVLESSTSLLPGHPAVPPTIEFEKGSFWPVAEVAATRSLRVVSGLPSSFAFVSQGGYNSASHQAVLLPIVPSTQDGPAAVLIIGLNPLRAFDDQYRAFLEQVGGQIAAAITAARAVEQERLRADAMAELVQAQLALETVRQEARESVAAERDRLRKAVAARLHAEAEMRQQVALIALAHDAIIVRDPGGRIIAWNNGAEALYGWSAGEARGQTTHLLLQTHVLPDGSGTVTDDELAARDAWDGELEHVRRDGTRLVVQSRQALLRAADGSPEAILEVNRDITAFHELERAREEFLSSATHDLKTPLTSIRGLVQLAQRRLARPNADTPAAVADNLARILEGTDVIVRLINDMEDATRQHLGDRLELHREKIDLVPLLEHVIAAQRDASARQILLETTLPEFQADVDAARIVRVIANLLSNALKYSPAESPITVILSRHEAPAGEVAVITVQDEGIGIPADDIPHIFDRFRRARNVTGRIQGTGIGLASARGIIEQHGGSISVESTEGIGSTFTVRLPVIAP